jgi:2,3-bisphosphoglycerate-dependent phosphoglycerate mutase
VLTYVLRHARTSYSARHWANGRPELAVPLDPHGQDQCPAARGTPPLDDIDTCVVSQFSRATQTAQLLRSGRPVPLVVDERLDEIDYGEYDGGPFLRGALTCPGPRLVVAHGLLLSLILSTRNGGCLIDTLLPEAPYVTATRFTDEELRHLADRMIEQTDTEGARRRPPQVVESALTNRSGLDRLHLSESSEDVDRHA